MGKNGDSPDMDSASDHSRPKRNVEKVVSDREREESLDGSQEQHISDSGVTTLNPDSNTDENALSQKLDPQGIHLTPVAGDVTRTCEEGREYSAKLRRTADSVATGENEATTTSASAPVYPPKKQVISSDDSLDRILDSGKLLRDIELKPSSFSSDSEQSESSATEEQEKISREDDSSLAGTPSYTVNVPADLDVKAVVGNTTGFDPGRRRVSILSMDGGGMRGLIAARILAHLESLLRSKTGEDVKLCDYFDFLAGTSTGAILTTMLITPDDNGQPLFTANECCKFYTRNGKNIFQARWYDVFKGKFRQFYRPKYSAKRFERLLKSYLIRNGKALTMRDTLNPFLVTSFDISQATPHIFVRQAAMKDDSKNFNLWEVCRGTAAAPTYFKPAEVKSVDGQFSGVLIDGGAIQNNPSLVAVTHVLGNNEEFPEASGLSDLLILSLGAGQLDEKHPLQEARKWGLTAWVRPLLNIMMDGSSDTIDYQLASAFAGHNCSENYLRIQLSGLRNKTPLMDCTTEENIKDLVNCADELLQQKAVMRNAYGEKVTLEVTYAERLSWFADQLIAQKKQRDEQGSDCRKAGRQRPDPTYGPGPTVRLVSPLINNLFMHQHTYDSSLTEHLKKAKSLRY